MKLHYACLCAASLLCLATSAAEAQAPAWSRASRIGGSGRDAGEAIAVDAAGNTYVAGQYNSASITIGTTTLTKLGSGTTNDMFVAKYSPAGAVLWATRLGGTGDDVASAVTVDGTGNVFVAGTFENSIAVAGTTLTSAGTTDMLLVRLNSQGVPQWGVRAGGPSNDIQPAITLDDAGFIWMGGSFQGTATVTGTSNTLVSAGGFDQALIKFNATTGAWVRMGREGGTGFDIVRGIVAVGDALYATGYFSSPTLSVGGTTLTRRCQQNDGYLIKYTRLLGFTWARSEGASSATTYANYAIAASADGSVVTAGEFQGTIVVGGFTTIANNGANPGPMTVRYTASGSVTGGLDGSSSGQSFGRATGAVRDGAGNTYITGYFRGNMQWSSTTISSAGNNDVFVVKIPASGNVEWVAKAGGSDNDLALDLALDDAGNCYLTGYFNASAPFGALTTLTSAGQTDAFVARLGGTVTSTRAARAATPLEAWPNPVAAGRTLHLTLPAARGTTTLRLLDVVGRVVHEQAIPASAVLTLPTTLAPGRYTAEVQTSEMLLRRALLVQ